MLRLKELITSVAMEQACGPSRDPHDHPPPGTLLPGDLAKPTPTPVPSTDAKPETEDTPSRTT